MRYPIVALTINGAVCLYIIFSDASLAMKALGLLLIGSINFFPARWLVQQWQINRLPTATLAVDNLQATFHYYHVTTATGHSLYRSVINPPFSLVLMATDQEIELPDDDRQVSTVPACLHFLEQQIRFDMAKTILPTIVSGYTHILYDGGFAFVADHRHFRGYVTYLSDERPKHRRPSRKQRGRWVLPIPGLAQI